MGKAVVQDSGKRLTGARRPLIARFFSVLIIIAAYFDITRKRKIGHIFSAQYFPYFADIFFSEGITVDFTMQVLRR